MTALINPFWFGGDPYIANVVLLLHLDGTNGSTTIIDNSPVGRTCTATGSSLTTAQQKFGTASWSQTSTTYITTVDSPDWLFGNGQFTVEAFARPTATISGTRTVLSQWPAGSSNFGWLFGFNGNTLNFFYSTTGTDLPVVTGAYTATLNQWVHLAADRDASNVLRVYADGVVIASGTVSVTFFNSTSSLYVGNDGNATRGLTGQIDEARITKGVARYGGAFTPPTAPFPNS